MIVANVDTKTQRILVSPANSTVSIINVDHKIQRILVSPSDGVTTVVNVDHRAQRIVVNPPSTAIVVENRPQRITVNPGGAYGSGGGSSTPQVLSYVHYQGTPSATWIISHGLGWFPNVRVIDSTGENVEGDLAYVSSNIVQLTFSVAFSGNAYLS